MAGQFRAKINSQRMLRPKNANETLNCKNARFQGLLSRGNSPKCAVQFSAFQSFGDMLVKTNELKLNVRRFATQLLRECGDHRD